MITNKRLFLSWTLFLTIFLGFTSRPVHAQVIDQNVTYSQSEIVYSRQNGEPIRLDIVIHSLVKTRVNEEKGTLIRDVMVNVRGTGVGIGVRNAGTKYVVNEKSVVSFEATSSTFEYTERMYGRLISQGSQDNEILLMDFQWFGDGTSNLTFEVDYRG